MSERLRNQAGKFAQKSDEPRKVRSIRLTDSTWQKLGELADEKSTIERRITRADLVEEWLQKDHVIQGQLELFDAQEEKPRSQEELGGSVDMSALKDEMKTFVLKTYSRKDMARIGKQSKYFTKLEETFDLFWDKLANSLGFS